VGSCSGLRRGFAAGLPIALGYLPVAITFGALARQAGLSTAEGVGMSIWVYAGASQFLALQMIATGARLAEIVLATFILNFRHFLMSTALAQRVRPRGPIVFLLAHGITDETFVVAGIEDDRRPLGIPAFGGLALAAHLAWVGGTLVGGLLVGLIPTRFVEGMAVGLYALFIALLVPSARSNWRAAATAGTSALAAWALRSWTPGLSGGWVLILATLGVSALATLLPDHDRRNNPGYQPADNPGLDGEP
jgi:4-azaleucine resistance transporter AzlC